MLSDRLPNVNFVHVQENKRSDVFNLLWISLASGDGAVDGDDDDDPVHHSAEFILFGLSALSGKIARTGLGARTELFGH